MSAITIETQMLIRKPVAEVFNAIIDPAVTSNFWFTKSSGKLVKGHSVKWEWEMYNVSANVFVKNIIEDKQITVEWGEPATTINFEFTSVGDQSTYVVIKNFGFDLSGDELLEAIKDNTGGFTTVLDGMKAYLEHNIKLNLIADKFPKEMIQHGK